MAVLRAASGGHSCHEARSWEATDLFVKLTTVCNTDILKTPAIAGPQSFPPDFRVGGLSRI